MKCTGASACEICWEAVRKWDIQGGSEIYGEAMRYAGRKARYAERE